MNFMKVKLVKKTNGKAARAPMIENRLDRTIRAQLALEELKVWQDYGLLFDELKRSVRGNKKALRLLNELDAAVGATAAAEIEFARVVKSSTLPRQ